MTVMSHCEGNCSGRTRFVPGPATADNRPTWEVLCEAGKPGGCKGPDFNELAELNADAGRALGSSPSPKPLVFSELGFPVARTWRQKI